MKIIKLDNLTKFQDNFDYGYLSERISKLVITNMEISNKDIYSMDEFKGLTSNKTKDSMENLIKISFLVYLENIDGEIIGCGMISRQHERYFAKTLHIDKRYQGKGYGRLICDIREEFLKSIGEKTIFIESLKYPETLKFHKSRGFCETPQYRPLKYTVLMKKAL